MPPASLLDLIAYTDWATARLLGTAAALDEAAWTQDLGGSFPTLAATLAHLVGVDWAWLHRWQGTSPPGRPAWADTPTPAGLRAAHDQTAAARRTFLAALTPADLARPCAYTLFSGATGTQPLGDLVVHVALHAAYHRGQVASMLRRLGVAPPPTDYFVYAPERDARDA